MICHLWVTTFGLLLAMSSEVRRASGIFAGPKSQLDVEHA
jgi:hypothetical protein